MKNPHLKHLFELNLAILVISTSGVLGKYISLSPPVIIWFRCFLAAIFLGVFVWYKKINLRVAHKKDLKIVVISSIFLGMHWVTYFYALHISNVAIGMLSLFTFPVVTALLEPFLLKTKTNSIQILLGLIVLIGIYFLTPEFNFENNYTKGIFFGLISSVFYSVRNILLKKEVKKYHSAMLMFYQMFIISLVLWPVFFIFQVNFTTNDVSALLILALLTTAVGHTLFVKSFKYFSVSTASIMSGIQPIYGILLAFVFLGEIPAHKTIIGGIIIISTVVIESFLSKEN